MLAQVLGAFFHKRKEETKLSKLYDKYRDGMYNAARRIGGGDADAEDAVHGAFVQISRMLDEIEEVDSLQTRGLMMTIVQRRALDIQRSRTRRQEVQLEAQSLPAKQDHSQQIADKEGLRRALHRLPEEGHEVLLLRYDVGMTVPEIAAYLGKSPDAVYKIIQRSKRRLADELRKEGFDIGYGQVPDGK